jgi:hypothetical protein
MSTLFGCRRRPARIGPWCHFSRRAGWRRWRRICFPRATLHFCGRRSIFGAALPRDPPDTPRHRRLGDGLDYARAARCWRANSAAEDAAASELDRMSGGPSSWAGRARAPLASRLVVAAGAHLSNGGHAGGHKGPTSEVPPASSWHLAPGSRLPRARRVIGDQLRDFTGRNENAAPRARFLVLAPRRRSRRRDLCASRFSSRLSCEPLVVVVVAVVPRRRISALSSSSRPAIPKLVRAMSVRDDVDYYQPGCLPPPPRVANRSSGPNNGDVIICDCESSVSARRASGLGARIEVVAVVVVAAAAVVGLRWPTKAAAAIK